LLAKWLSAPEQQARFIQASGTFPTRASTLDLLESFATDQPQWASAQELLTKSRSEPTYASWSVVRWVVGDVGTQIFRYYFTGDRISATLELMDETAAELHARPAEPPRNCHALTDLPRHHLQRRRVRPKSRPRRLGCFAAQRPTRKALTGSTPTPRTIAWS
jgi:hypothetical protein